MFRLTRSQIQPIGLDIGHDSVRLLQLEASGESISVVAAARQNFGAEIRNDAALRLASAGPVIKQLLRENSFQGRRIVAAIPREILHVKNLRLPMMPAEELESAVRFEARSIFSFDSEEAQIHAQPVGEVRQGGDVLQEVIVLAAKHEDVDRYIEQLHRFGVIVESLDAEPCALYRSVERFVRRREDEQEVNVLVDIGLRRTQVVIGKGRDISFFKPVEIGGVNLHEAIARKLSISLDEAQAVRRRLVENSDDDAAQEPVRQAVRDAARSVLEELAREVSLCMRYHSVTFRGHRPTRVRLLGGEASDPQLLHVFNSTLPVPAEAGKPLLSVDISKMKPADRHGTLGEWAMALGLGLKRTQGKFGARDGKPRETLGIAQTVDMGKALETLASEEAPTEANVPRSTAVSGVIDARKTRRETTHA